MIDDPTEWVTYRMANGEPIFGEYAWVENPEFFDDVSEPVEVVKETWALVSVEPITFGGDEPDDDDKEATA